MNDLKIFESSQFGKIRTSVTESGEPLFCLVDVCRILGLTNPSQVKTTLQRCGVISNEVSTPIISQGVNTGKTKIVELNFITEPNLYKCIFQSRKPEAEAFQDWVCGEVLPSIRKSGGYIVSSPNDTPEDILARAVLVAQESIERKNKQISELQETLNNKDHQLQIESMRVEEKQQQIEEQQKTISDLTPGYNFSRAVEASKKSILISEMAKILTQNGYVIGQNRLYKYLRDNGYLFSKGEQYNLPVQRYMEMGIFEIKKVVISQPGGTAITTNTTKITPKGQIYFVNKFIAQKGGVA